MKSFLKTIKKLTADIRTYIKKDESGVERLAGYVKHPDGFPIEAYLVVCSRLKKRTDKLVFTLREQWPLEVIEQTYNGLPCVQAAREAKRETLGIRGLKREDKFEIVGEVLRDMPNATVTDQTEEIRARFIKEALQKPSLILRPESFYLLHRPNFCANDCSGYF